MRPDAILTPVVFGLCDFMHFMSWNPVYMYSYLYIGVYIRYHEVYRIIYIMVFEYYYILSAFFQWNSIGQRHGESPQNCDILVTPILKTPELLEYLLATYHMYFSCGDICKEVPLQNWSQNVEIGNFKTVVALQWSIYEWSYGSVSQIELAPYLIVHSNNVSASSSVQYNRCSSWAKLTCGMSGTGARLQKFTC